MIGHFPILNYGATANDSHDVTGPDVNDKHEVSAPPDALPGPKTQRQSIMKPTKASPKPAVGSTNLPFAATQPKVDGNKKPTRTQSRMLAVYKAMEILLEQGAGSKEDLLQLACPFTTEEMHDVAEERALSGVCGNPLCTNPPAKRKGIRDRFMEDPITGELIDRPSDWFSYCTTRCRSTLAMLCTRLGGVDDALLRYECQQRDKSMRGTQASCHSDVPQHAAVVHNNPAAESRQLRQTAGEQVPRSATLHDISQQGVVEGDEGEKSQQTVLMSDAKTDSAVEATASDTSAAAAAPSLLTSAPRNTIGAFKPATVAHTTSSDGHDSSLRSVSDRADDTQSTVLTCVPESLDAAAFFASAANNGATTAPRGAAALARDIAAQAAPGGMHVPGGVVSHGQSVSKSKPSQQPRDKPHILGDVMERVPSAGGTRTLGANCIGGKQCGSATAVEGYRPRNPLARKKGPVQFNKQGPSAELATVAISSLEVPETAKDRQARQTDAQNTSLSSRKTCHLGVGHATTETFARGNDANGPNNITEWRDPVNSKDAVRTSKRRVSFAETLEQVQLIPHRSDAHQTYSVDSSSSYQTVAAASALDTHSANITEGLSDNTSDASKSASAVQRSTPVSTDTVEQSTADDQQVEQGITSSDITEQRQPEGVAGPKIIFDISDSDSVMNSGSDDLAQQFGRLVVADNAPQTNIGAAGVSSVVACQHGHLDSSSDDEERGGWADVGSGDGEDDLIPRSDDETDEDDFQRASALLGHWTAQACSGIRAELSTFGQLYILLQGWSTETSRDWVLCPKGTNAVSPETPVAPSSARPPTKVGTAAQDMHRQVTLRLLEQQLPLLMENLQAPCLLSAASTCLAQLLDCFFFKTPTPILKAKEWQLLVLVLLKAISLQRLSALQPVLDGRLGLMQLHREATRLGSSIEEVAELLVVMCEDT